MPGTMALALPGLPMAPGMAPGAMPMGATSMPMPMPAYGQMVPQQAYGQLALQQHMNQMGYPKMNPDGSFAGIHQPGFMTNGYAPNPHAATMPLGSAAADDYKRHRLKFGYMDDAARLHGWVLSQLARVYHE